jgi:hypothetical protein
MLCYQTQKKVGKVRMTRRVQCQRQRWRWSPCLGGLLLWNLFICKEDGGLCYIVGRGDHFLKDIIGTDGLCDKGLGQDDED